MNKFVLFTVFTIFSVAFLMQSVESKPVEESIDNSEIDPICICTFENNPVCGSNNQTYSNPCDLQCAAEKLQKNGVELFLQYYGSCTNEFEHEFIEESPEESSDISAEEDDLDCICTMEYNPVCGNDNQTYSNPCSLQCAVDRQLRKGEHLFMKHFGSCMDQFSKLTDKFSNFIRKCNLYSSKA